MIPRVIGALGRESLLPEGLVLIGVMTSKGDSMQQAAMVE